LEFDLPRIIEGTAILNITEGIVFSAAAAGGVAESTITTALKKISGGATTVLRSASASLLTINPVIADMLRDQKTHCILLKDIPKTKFKGGDKLRLSIEQWFKNSDGGNAGYVGFAHDPKNRLDDIELSPVSGASRILELQVPFKIDL